MARTKAATIWKYHNSNIQYQKKINENDIFEKSI